MGTRSQIGIMNEDGSITTVYCHWDGYLSHNGKILLENYDTQEKVLELIKGGDMSFLVENIEDTDYYAKTAYSVDTDPITYADMNSYIAGHIESWCEYFYLFKDGQWQYLTHPRNLTWYDLSEAVIQLETNLA